MSYHFAGITALNVWGLPLWAWRIYRDEAAALQKAQQQKRG